jgi:branched-chain amino acid transport system permease protein
MQILINGLIQGLIIALSAIGFSIIYNSTGILHISQGALYAIAPYLMLSLVNTGCSIAIAIAVTLTASVLISLLFEVLNHWPLYKKGAALQTHFISSLGIYIVFIQLISLIWGNDTRVLREGVDVLYGLMDVTITRSQALGGAISLVVILCFFAWLRRTSGGTKFMALSDNPIQLALMGYDIGRLRLLAFGMSGIFTMLSSVLTAVDIGFDPHGGMNMVLLAIVATIIGGKGSFVGPVVGGILLGIIRSQIVWYTSAKWEDAVSFLILVLFLFIRPQGIFGDKGRIETE